MSMVAVKYFLQCTPREWVHAILGAEKEIFRVKHEYMNIHPQLTRDKPACHLNRVRNDYALGDLTQMECSQSGNLETFLVY